MVDAVPFQFLGTMWLDWTYPAKPDKMLCDFYALLWIAKFERVGVWQAGRRRLAKKFSVPMAWKAEAAGESR